MPPFQPPFRLLANHLHSKASFPILPAKSFKNPNKTTFFRSFPFCIPYGRKMCRGGAVCESACPAKAFAAADVHLWLKNVFVFFEIFAVKFRPFRSSCSSCSSCQKPVLTGTLFCTVCD
jgi:hypothetical protein